MSVEEIVRLTKLFVGLGVTKVRLTGGEPTVRRGLVDLIEELRKLSSLQSILMTTNGTTLASCAEAYRSAGLNGLNISLDSVRPDRFREITRGGSLARVLAGVDAALEAGYDSVKINIVVMKGVNDDELCDFVRFGIDRQVHVRFIEYMPFLGNEWKRAGVLTYRDMLAAIQSEFELSPLSVERSSVAKEFGVVSGRSTIGFVTSVTDDFCGACNRIRLTANGQLKTCLFSRAEDSLLDLARSGATDAELATVIHRTLARKWAGHPSMDRWVGLDDRAMVQIGG